MKQQNITLLIGGLIFGFGLAVGGMSKPEIVLSFLKLEDLGLLVLMGCAAGIDFIAINIVPRFIEKPLLGGEFKPRERKFGRNTIIGAIIFGVGWGLSGLCPGAALASLGIGNIPVLTGIGAMFVGAYVMG
ncbi:MAG: DUF6691 family protein, partial [Candidatus Bathyarchaeota archaeon]